MLHSRQGSILALHAAVNQQNQVLFQKPFPHRFLLWRPSRQGITDRSLRPKASLLELLTVRHPLTWLSIPTTVGICILWNRSREFLPPRPSHARCLPCCHGCATDFCLRPKAALKGMTDVPQLEPLTRNLSDQDIKDIQLSGDSGRRSDLVVRVTPTIQSRNKAPLIKRSIPNTNSSYLKLCDASSTT